MMGTARYTFNQTVNYLNDQGTFANWMAIKKGIIDSLPEWSRETPYQVRSIAVKDACEAVKLAKRKFKKTGKFNKVHFKRRKDVRQSLFITKAAISEKGIFVRVLGKMFYTEPLPKINHDCRLVYEYGKWFVSIPVDVEKQIAKNKQNTVSIDPGVRTFLTCYTSDGVIELGSSAWERTLKICHSLDSIQSRMTKAKARRKQNMKRAFKRLQFRLDNLKAELHWKCATFLAKNFDTIVIPNFNANEMSARHQRKITSKTVRSMLSLGHSRFREILKMQCEKYGGNVLTTTEEYTSKTCPACGEIHARLGGAKVYKCPHCGCKVPRDANGARNILLRAMVDSPTLVKQCATVGFC